MENFHIVRPGDAVDRIAGAHDTSRAELLELNPWLRDRPDYVVYPEERIRVPELVPTDDAMESPRSLAAAQAPGLTPTPPRPTPRPAFASSPAERPSNTSRPAGLPGQTPLETPLRSGDEGPQVELLQQLLNRRGFTTSVDGEFGPGTARQVRAFQRAYGLAVDGVVGQNTWTMLLRDRPGSLQLNEEGRDYVRRLRLDPETANRTDFDALARAEAEHAQSLLIEAGFGDLAPSITPELLKAMWFRESHLDPTANEGNGRGLGQITRTGFYGIFAGDFMPRALDSERGWLSLARAHSDRWPASRDEAWRHFRDHWSDPEFNASLSTVWLTAQLMRNARTDHPLREALEDYNGSSLRHTYARQVMRLRNAFLHPIAAPGES